MIIDEQIIHLIGTDGIVCLPMTCRGEHVGVMVLGTDETEVLHLFKRMKLLTMFTNQAALAIHLDRTRKRQEELLQAERITAFSTLARQVNHEVNNPLGIIKNYLKILGMKLAKEDPVQGELVIINEEIDRVSAIISELSRFDQPRVRQTEDVNINGLLSDLISITKKSLVAGSRIRFHLTLDPALPDITTEKNSLKQAVINLIKNAIEAMPEGGNIFIETQHHPQLPEEPPPAGRLPGGTQAEITVRDDGPGIPDSIKRRLYEPHASTKGAGHFGLGLSLAYASVADAGGTLICESESNKGTCFRILLPGKGSQ
jgi:signal transduction histidine kinase